MEGKKTRKVKPIIYISEDLVKDCMMVLEKENPVLLEVFKHSRTKVVEHVLRALLNAYFGRK